MAACGMRAASHSGDMIGELLGQLLPLGAVVFSASADGEYPENADGYGL